RLHEQALIYREKGGNQKGKAYSYSKIANLYKDLGQPNEAISYFQQAYAIYENQNDSVEMAGLYASLGELYHTLKNEPESRAYYLHAYQIVKGMGLRQETSDYAENIAISYFQDTKYDSAEKYHRESYSIRKDIGDKSGQMYSLCNLAQIQWFAHYNPKEAENQLLQAMNLARELQSKEIIAYCFQVHGSLKTSMGDTRMAERLFDSAYIVYDQIGDVKGKCSILLYQGANEINKGRFDAAADKYFASLKLASENNQNLSKGDAYNYL